MWEGWNIAPEGGVVVLVNKDAEECGSLFTRVGLKLGVDFDDEGRGYSREQTGLIPWSVWIR